MTILLETTQVLHLPVARTEVGFSLQGDYGNAVLLDARDCAQAATLAAYQTAGYLHEGVRIASCAEEIYALLEQLHLTWCPWPDEGFTLVVLEHACMGVLAERLVLQRLTSAAPHIEKEEAHVKQRDCV